MQNIRIYVNQLRNIYSFKAAVTSRIPKPFQNRQRIMPKTRPQCRYLKLATVVSHLQRLIHAYVHMMNPGARLPKLLEKTFSIILL
jgi:hypothetical protein